MGGIPYYLRNLSPQLSYTANIDALFFKKKGRLWDEFTHLYQTLFSNSDVYIQVVEVLAAKQSGMNCFWGVLFGSHLVAHMFVVIRVLNKTAQAVLFGCFESCLRRSRKKRSQYDFLPLQAACYPNSTIKWQQAILSRISIILFPSVLCCHRWHG